MKLSTGLAISLTLVLAGCGSTSGPTTSQETLIAPDCVFPDAPQVKAPLWVCDVPVEGFQLTAVGFSEKRPTAAMTSNAANVDARTKMSEHFATSVAQLFSEYQKSLETDQEQAFMVDTNMVRESVSSATLFGTKVIRSITSPSQGRYVVIAMDKDTYKANAETLLAGMMDDDARVKRLFEDEQARTRLMGMITTGN